MLDRRPIAILADDHPMMLAGLRNLLEPTLDVVATATDGQALVEIATHRRPDLVIVDVSMPGIDGIEATHKLRTLSPDTRVLILSFHKEPSWVRAAFDAGACGYLTKTAAPEEIEGAIRQVLDGRFYLSPSVTRALISPLQPEPPMPATPAGTQTLTPRERDVVRLVGQGLPNKEIAHELGISVTTVRTHLSKVYEKIGRSNRLELALHAAQLEAGAS